MTEKKQHLTAWHSLLKKLLKLMTNTELFVTVLLG